VAPAPVTLTVTDTVGQTVSKQFTLTVNPAPALTITTTSVSAGTVGTKYSAQMAATGGSGSYTWSASALPSGLTMSSAGLISGTPTAVNTSKNPSTITVVDNNNASSRAQETIVIQIQAAPVIIQ
jgi:hypothetical protein